MLPKYYVSPSDHPTQNHDQIPRPSPFPLLHSLRHCHHILIIFPSASFEQADCKLMIPEYLFLIFLILLFWSLPRFFLILTVFLCLWAAGRASPESYNYFWGKDLEIGVDWNCQCYPAYPLHPMPLHGNCICYCNNFEPGLSVECPSPAWLYPSISYLAIWLQPWCNHLYPSTGVDNYLCQIAYWFAFGGNSAERCNPRFVWVCWW